MESHSKIATKGWLLVSLLAAETKELVLCARTRDASI